MMGRVRAKGRAVHGILLLDKPPGLTLQCCAAAGQAAVSRPQGRAYRQPGPAGHRACLPICLGEATKVSGFLLDADKHYWVACRLGVRTTHRRCRGRGGGDAARWVRCTEAQCSRGLRALQRQHRADPADVFGRSSTRASAFTPWRAKGSKWNGSRARMTIHELNSWAPEATGSSSRLHCSKGTYVRTLAEDIGEALGCGAHVTGLRRLGVGPYNERPDGDPGRARGRSTARTGRHWTSCCCPMESGAVQWPDVNLTGDAAFYLRQGQPVLVPHAPTSGWVRLYGRPDAFWAWARLSDDGRVAPRRLLNIGDIPFKLLSRQVPAVKIRGLRSSGTICARVLSQWH